MKKFKISAKISVAAEPFAVNPDYITSEKIIEYVKDNLTDIDISVDSIEVDEITTQA